uniref:MH1 domain-containing protein n=1 Tax=Steinernema glaseri TaxID=37863 RepID=A0A1I8A3L6_9BILA
MSRRVRSSEVAVMTWNTNDEKSVETSTLAITRSRARPKRRLSDAIFIPRKKRTEETKGFLVSAKQTLIDMTLRLYKKGNLEKLREFMAVIASKGEAKQCVPLERCRDGRMQVGLGKVFPAVCVLNLFVEPRASKVTVTKLPICELGCKPVTLTSDGNAMYECINPWHYEFTQHGNNERSEAANEEKQEYAEETQERTEEPLNIQNLTMEKSTDFDFGDIPCEFTSYDKVDARGPLELKRSASEIRSMRISGPLAVLL